MSEHSPKDTYRVSRSFVTEMLTEDGESHRVVVNEAENALYWLFKRGKISPEQFAAGERLRSDYTGARLEMRMTSDWERSIEGAGRGRAGFDFLSEKTLAARHRFHKAIDDAGPELAGMLSEVCCLSAGLEQAERRLALPARSGKVVLGLALTRLARHYGMIKPEAPPRTEGATRHWGIPGFRPEIEKPGGG